MDILLESPALDINSPTLHRILLVLRHMLLNMNTVKLFSLLYTITLLKYLLHQALQQLASAIMTCQDY